MLSYQTKIMKKQMNDMTRLFCVYFIYCFSFCAMTVSQALSRNLNFFKMHVANIHVGH